MADPYAEFQQPAQSNQAQVTKGADPYAEFQQAAPAQAAPPEQPGLYTRVGARLKQNLNPMAMGQAVTSGITDVKNRLKQPYVPGSGLKETWQSLKNTYSDPANVIGDALGGYILGQAGGEGPMAKTAPEAPRAMKAPVSEPMRPIQTLRGTQQSLPLIMGENIGPGVAAAPKVPAPIAETVPKASIPVPEPAMAETSLSNLPRSTGDPYAMKNTPAMDPAQSSNLAKTGYHPESNTMVVEYKNGRVYEYKGVPSKVYEQFKDAESQGSFVAQNVKGRYQTNYRGSVLGTSSKPSAAPAPQYAYRTRTVGEQGVPMTRGAASATSDLGQAQSYVQSRGDVESAPQEVVRVDLSKLKSEDYHAAQHPSGAQWYSFHKDIPESAIERVGSGSKQTRASKLSK